MSTSLSPTIGNIEKHCMENTEKMNTRLLDQRLDLILTVLVTFNLVACGSVTPGPAPAPAPSPVRASTPSPATTSTSEATAGFPFPRLAKVTDPPGGHITDIAFASSDPNVVYLSSNVNAMGVWRSDNGGQTWRRVFYDDNFDATHTEVLAVHPTDSNYVLLGDVYGEIVRTTDGGKSWHRVRTVENPPIPIYALAFSPSQPTTVYAADAIARVFKSNDAGASWNLVSRLQVGAIGSLVVSPMDPQTAYIGGRNGVYETGDGGKTWQRISWSAEVVEVAVAATDPRRLVAATIQGVYRSADGGKTWELTLNRHAHSVQVSLTDLRIVYAGTIYGVYRSDDGALTWRYVNNGIEFLDIGPLTIHPRNPNSVLAANNIWQWTYHSDPFPPTTKGEGIYKTTDGGNTWIRSTVGFGDVDLIAITIDPNDPRVLFVGTERSRGLYRSNNGGDSWVLVPGGPEETSWDIAHYTMRLAMSRDSTVFMTGRFGITRSTDQGQKWIDTLFRRHFHGIAISPHDTRLIFAGTAPHQRPGHSEAEVYPGGRIFRSGDGGQTWQEVSEGFPSGSDTSIHDFAFDALDPQVIYVSTSSHEVGIPRSTETFGIYKSTDGGFTWTPINNGLTNLNVDVVKASPTTPGLVYAGTESGVFRSTDGGSRWQPLGLTLEIRSMLIDPTDPRIVYAGTERGLYWTSNGGETWQKVDAIPDKLVPDIVTDPKGKILYVVVNDVGIFKGERKE